tara:strand:- start:162 stop:689 length:528 start_codon:yes stop_codon:yes gene_type:complete
MSFDLTNKNISDTFQNLLQQTGSSSQIYDLEGTQVNHINITNISASVLEIPNSSDQSGNKLHSRSGTLYFGDTNLASGGGGITNVIEDTTPQLGGQLDLNDKTISGSMIVTGSLEVKSVNATDDFFLLKTGSLDSVKVNGQGVLQLGGFTFTPTAVRGGVYYNHTEDEFFVGKNN